MSTSRSDLRMWISIKDVKHGNDNVILSTGFTDMTKAINDANTIITDLWGGYNTTTESPNWGMLIYNAGMVYQDAIGQIAWVVLFSLPFLMMWIVQADMTLPSLVGMLFSLYVFLKLPAQYIMLSVGMFAISIAALVWSLYRRAY